jgi:hypothetical protein
MVLLSIYVIGVVVGLVVMRDSWLPRLATALVWPLGPIAFLLVVPLLLIAALILWPLVMLPAVAIAALLIWLM